MARINEVLPIVVDPNHERFGHIGEMVFSGASGDGTCIIKFEDGEEAHLNDGWLTGVPQFVAPLRTEEAGVRRLKDALPEMQKALRELADKVTEPRKQPPAEETLTTRAGFVALINKVLFETTTK
ncbi:hypothetical protein HY003_02665 [Candidatus Saccharibacteria bacterium]|nr:hypothetical protein [Candidatus Saccharibacteria bacterium]MBI3338180.1 hypothetical protein [Candidatus Saccharibacteria bacterium]